MSESQQFWQLINENMVNELKGKTCIFCHSPLVYRDRDNLPGTVYSAAGLSEVNISGSCETCFDNITRPPDE